MVNGEIGRGLYKAYKKLIG